MTFDRRAYRCLDLGLHPRDEVLLRDTDPQAPDPCPLPLTLSDPDPCKIIGHGQVHAGAVAGVVAGDRAQEDGRVGRRPWRKGPIWSSDEANASSPKRLTRPYVGFTPTTPQRDAGWRTLPPVSDPKAPRHSSAATAAALPPLDPPGTRLRSHGLRVVK